MSEASITIIVAGAIQVIGMLVGFFTMWVKLRYASDKADEAARKATVVETKLDANTTTTNSMNTKTDTIVQQTDGALAQVKTLAVSIAERVSKLEDANRERSHRLFDVMHAVGLKVERLLTVYEVKSPPASMQATTKLGERS